MLHTEVIECLRILSDETLSKVMRMIFDWNDGFPVEPQNEIEKFAWAMILPKLEANKETYLSIIERNRENGKKGGRPKNNENPNNPMGYFGNPKKANYNYNSIDNTSNEVLSNNSEQHSSLEGDEVVSDGLAKLESIFPSKKNSIDIDTINLWNSLNQDEKQFLIRKATVYIREEKKKNEGMYIKQLPKWLREQKEKGILSTMNNTTNLTSTKDERLFKFTNGNVYNRICDIVGGSTTVADKLYHRHNRKDLYSSADEMIQGILNEYKTN